MRRLAHPGELRSDHVILEPAEPGHAPALFAISSLETFRYFLSHPAEWTLPAFTRWFAAHAENPRNRVFVVRAPGSLRVVGSTSLIDPDPANLSIEIGFTWYSPDVRGTTINPAAKLLLFDHAFARAFIEPDEQATGCVRVTLKCDSRNEHSRRAITKLGASFEGVLRQHRIMMDGYVRDTAYFSVVAAEWPAVRARLESRLSG